MTGETMPEALEESLLPDREEYLRSVEPDTIYPVVLELPLNGLDPYRLYRRLRSGGRGYLLETGRGAGRSYVGVRCRRVWTSKGDRCELTGSDSRTMHGDPFELLRREFEGTRVIPNPRLGSFRGGAVGYFSYDMARHIERIPEIAVDDPAVPDSCFLFCDGFFECDPGADALRLAATIPAEGLSPAERYDASVALLREMAAVADAPDPADGLDVESVPTAASSDLSSCSANVSRERFEEMVRRAKDYIVAGDIFQVNLSVRFQREFPVDPLLLYGVLRLVNPSPYMCFFETPDLSIVSASPELLVSVHNRVIETRPIAGTRPRGVDDATDQERARELIENEKERAEHVMLVDLERNDIGRVARYGSVEVNEFMAIERYSHVIHIVSNVRGELAEGRDLFDAVRACFPGGTITGAPKVRTMEIIEELEPCRRGIYTGSIGWLGYDGDAALNIAIRTVVVRDGIAYMQAGAGIVADSEPSAEYRESLRKAEAALVALDHTLELNAARI